MQVQADRLDRGEPLEPELLKPPCPAQEIANLLWGLATAKHRPPPAWLLACVRGPLTSLLPRMRNQELCNAAWALASLQFYPGAAWCDAATRELLLSPERRNTLKSVDVAHWLWSMAALGHQPADRGALAALLGGQGLVLVGSMGIGELVQVG